MIYGAMLAGGSGTRVKSSKIPKQFIEIGGKPIIIYTLENMLKVKRFDYIYIAVLALVSYTIRSLPLTLIRKPIKNQFIQSFLYYVPYVTLSVMTFPAIVHATQSPVSGALALVVGIAAAWFGANLFQVSVACCAVVFVIELFL